MSTDEYNKLLDNVRRMLNTNPSMNLLSIAYRSLLISQTLQMVTPQIASHLSFPDLISLTQVCKSSRKWQGSILASSITSLLKPFVSDPIELRKVMNETGSIISGSTVVWFLQKCPDRWSPNDLDIYTPLDRSDRLIQYLVSEGYSIVSKTTLPNRIDQPTMLNLLQDLARDLEETYLSRATRLRSVTKLLKDNTRVDVIESADKSAVAPLLRFHSTIPMNYISAGTIKSFYPKLFFEDIGVIQRDIRHREFNWTTKYESRGFNIMERSDVPLAYAPSDDQDCGHTHDRNGEHHYHERTRYGLCAALSRKSDDRYTMTLKVAFRSEDGEHRYFEEFVEPITWTLGPFSTTHRLCDPGNCALEEWKIPGQFDLTAKFIHKYTQNSMIRMALKCLGYDVHKLAAYQNLLLTDNLQAEIEHILQNPLVMLNYVSEDRNDLKHDIKDQLSILTSHSAFPRPFPMDESPLTPRTGFWSSRSRGNRGAPGSYLL